MVVNFKTSNIKQDACKLTQILALIIKKKTITTTIP
jgi:hypothetical protein